MSVPDSHGLIYDNPLGSAVPAIAGTDAWTNVTDNDVETRRGGHYPKGQCVLIDRTDTIPVLPRVAIAVAGGVTMFLGAYNGACSHVYIRVSTANYIRSDEAVEVNADVGGRVDPEASFREVHLQAT